jgi:Glycosyltransferase 61
MDHQKGFSSRLARHVKQSFKRFAKACLCKLVGRFSFALFGVPSGTSSGKEDGKVTILYSEVPFSMQLPKTIESEIFWHYKHVSQEKFSLPADGLLFVADGTATSKGGNLSKKGELITTFLQPIDEKIPQNHDLHHLSIKKFSPRIYTSKSPVVTLAAGWQGAFYHWVYEVLPRLHLAEKGGYSQEHLYIEATHSFQKQSLELMGVSPDQLIDAGVFGGVKTPQLIVPSLAETPTYWGCQFLRERIIPKLSPKKPQRIYISRSDASRRRIVNEEEVMTLLKGYGFEKILLSPLNFKEQAEFFLSAEAVVGPHGAGFSHLVFCKPKTPFLEIFSPAYFNPCYWHVSERVNLDYYYLFGEGKRYPDGFKTGTDPDILVDVTRLETSLKLMSL